MTNGSFSNLSKAAAVCKRSNVVLEQSARDVGCFFFPYYNHDVPFMANMKNRA